MTHGSLSRTALFASLLAALGPAVAQTQRSGGEAQKFMQQYQQLSAEKTSLQAQLAQSKKDLDQARADLATMKKERDALKAHPAGVSPATVAQLKASKESAERAIDQSKQRMAELVSRFRETASTLKDTEADRALLRSDLDLRNAAFDRCADANQQLYDINRDLLTHIEPVGLFTKISAQEPFTQITRNRLDNLVLETHERAEQLRVKKRSP